jgi:hypothetical protein
MKKGELKEYLYTELKEMKQYIDKHPELSRKDAANEWVKIHAATFSNKWKETHN